MNATLKIAVNFDYIDCWNCGGTYALSANYLRVRSENGGSWNCPYCKQSTAYATTEVVKLKKQIKQKDEQIKREQTRTRTARTNATYQKNRARALKGAKTRMLNRIKNGYCPCCSYQFKNLKLHMKKSHPDFNIDKHIEETIKCKIKK